MVIFACETSLKVLNIEEWNPLIRNEDILHHYKNIQIQSNVSLIFIMETEGSESAEIEF